MDDDIIKAVNAWYEDFKNLPEFTIIYQDDRRVNIEGFQARLTAVLPDYRFSFIGDEWLLINKI